MYIRQAIPEEEGVDVNGSDESAWSSTEQTQESQLTDPSSESRCTHSEGPTTPPVHCASAPEAQRRIRLDVSWFVASACIGADLLKLSRL